MNQQPNPDQIIAEAIKGLAVNKPKETSGYSNTSEYLDIDDRIKLISELRKCFSYELKE